jgi:hypothetical protein
MKIERPSPKIIKRYLNLWDSLDSYVMQESSLEKLFSRTYPLNTDLDDVLIKVCSLNDFYSTNIFSPYTVAKHIVELEIDGRLNGNDVSLVNDIATIMMNNGVVRRFYSFATKYCSHHKPLEYPIYDSYVDKLLMALKRQDKFAKFKKGDLKEYPRFKEILIEFRTYYELTDFNLKEIDKYLWQAGKEYFPRKK